MDLHTSNLEIVTEDAAGVLCGAASIFKVFGVHTPAQATIIFRQSQAAYVSYMNMQVPRRASPVTIAIVSLSHTCHKCYQGRFRPGA